MNEQLNIYDYTELEYNGTRDEILRLHEERKLENQIRLLPCCGCEPVTSFLSCKEYRVRCLICGRHTDYKRHAYQAMQAWNKGEVTT